MQAIKLLLLYYVCFVLMYIFERHYLGTLGGYLGT